MERLKEDYLVFPKLITITKQSRKLSIFSKMHLQQMLLIKREASSMISKFQKVLNQVKEEVTVKKLSINPRLRIRMTLKQNDLRILRMELKRIDNKMNAEKTTDAIRLMNRRKRKTNEVQQSTEVLMKMVKRWVEPRKETRIAIETDKLTGKVEEMTPMWDKNKMLKVANQSTKPNYPKANQTAMLKTKIKIQRKLSKLSRLNSKRRKIEEDSEFYINILKIKIEYI